MIDIVDVQDDIQVFDTQVPKAGNVLSIQLGSLEYLPLFGIDLKYFLSEEFKFQNEAFRAYLVEVLANNGINVVDIDEIFENLFELMTIEVGPDQSGEGFMAR